MRRLLPAVHGDTHRSGGSDPIPGMAASGLAIGGAAAFYNCGTSGAGESVPNAVRHQFNLSSGNHSDPSGLVTTSGSNLVIAADGIYTLIHQTVFPTADINSTKAFKQELQTTASALDLFLRNNWAMAGPLSGTENPDNCQTLTAAMVAGDTISTYWTHNFGSTITIKSVVYIHLLAA